MRISPDSTQLRIRLAALPWRFGCSESFRQLQAKLPKVLPFCSASIAAASSTDQRSEKKICTAPDAKAASSTALPRIALAVAGGPPGSPSTSGAHSS